MGTSGAYGGSPGWGGVRDSTDQWIDGRPASGSGGGEGGDDPAHPPEPPDRPPEVPNTPTPSPRPIVDPGVSQILQQIARLLAPRTGDSGGGATSGGRSLAGSQGGGRASSATATRSGGSASAGAYGYRAGDPTALSDLGLDLDDLRALGPYDRAKRIVDAASGSGAAIDQAEVKQVNADVVLWSLELEEVPSPADVVRRWVTEYVWQVWLTETGARLRDGSRQGEGTVALEREVRSTLEASVASVDFPPDGLRAEHFQGAIEQLLGRLERIFGQGGESGEAVAS